MPWVWVWVGVGLVVWTLAAFAVIALCRSAQRIDAQLGRDRKGVAGVMKTEPRPGAEVEVE